MTRMDSVRAASDSAKESVLHAAEVVAPYAETARDQAAHYAQEARVRITPKVSRAAKKARVQARAQYECHVAPHVPPKVDAAAHRAVDMTRSAARQATDYTVPRVEHAVAATGPVLEEAGSRSTAAWAALRGQVTPKDIEKIVKKQERRARAGRLAKGLAVLGLVAGGAFAVWKWWDKQANPDWLIEPPAPTEVGEDPGASLLETEPVRENGIEDAADSADATEVSDADAVEPDERR